MRESLIRHPSFHLKFNYVFYSLMTQPLREDFSRRLAIENDALKKEVVSLRFALKEKSERVKNLEMELSEMVAQRREDGRRRVVLEGKLRHYEMLLAKAASNDPAVKKMQKQSIVTKLQQPAIPEELEEDADGAQKEQALDRGHHSSTPSRPHAAQSARPSSAHHFGALDPSMYSSAPNLRVLHKPVSQPNVSMVNGRWVMSPQGLSLLKCPYRFSDCVVSSMTGPCSHVHYILTVKLSPLSLQKSWALARRAPWQML